MSFSTPQDSPSPHSVTSTPSSSRFRELTDDGKRILSQLERSAKVGRVLSETGNISTAFQAIQCTGSDFSVLSSPPLAIPVDFPPPACVHQCSAVEYALHILRKHKLEEYRQAVYIPPLAKSSLQTSDDNLFPLMDKVQDFLAGDGQVMLILGDSGVGKSTFNRYLEYELWRDYNIGDCIPLFINLPALERPEKELVAEQLRTYDFTEEQIRELKQHRQFMLICDGYDESQLTNNLHTTNLLNRSGQWSAKLLITCRTQYLGTDYQDCFVPQQGERGHYSRPALDLFQEVVIAPFSKDQIESYVERHVPFEPRNWIKKDYMDKLTTIPNLMDLVKNPFLLTLSLETLPSVVQDRSSLSGLRITRVQLYDTFVEHWLGVNKRRLQGQKLTSDDLRAFNELKDDGFIQRGTSFQIDLAAAIFREQDGKPVVEYIPKRDKISWKATFFSPEPETALLRGASLLSRTGNHYRFAHRSILEYFYSCTICAPVNVVPQDRFDFTDTQQSIADHPLSHRNHVVEPSIIQFLAERVRLITAFKLHLRAIIELSKTDDNASQAAANAITILVKAGVRFNGVDLRGVRISGADLSTGQFDSTKLQGANLKDVNLTRTWIRQADLSNALMDGVQFGELPYLKEAHWVNACIFSPNGMTFAAGLHNGDINIYDTATWTRIDTFQEHSMPITSLAFSPSSQQLVSGSGDRTARIWNCRAGSTEVTLKGHTDEVAAVAFSPFGNQIATGSDDRSVRLWDAQTGAVVSVLECHTSKVFSVAYSPDGRHVVSGSKGGIQIFDSQTGIRGLALRISYWSILCLAYSPDGQQIVAGNKFGTLQLWETSTGKAGSTWEGHASEIWGLDYSPNGQWIASSGVDHTVKLWSAQEGVLLSVFRGHTWPATSVVFSPDGSQLASGSWDKTVRLWGVNSAGPSLDSHGSSDPVSSVAYSADGKTLISGSQDGTVRRCDTMTGESEVVIQGGPFHTECVVYSPDGLQIATAGFSGDVRIWNAGTGLVDFTLSGHTSGVNTVAFSPSSHWIATGSNDSTVRLWDSYSGTPGHVLNGHTSKVISVVFPADEQRRLISGSEDGSIRIWEIDAGESRSLCVEKIVGIQAVGYSPSTRHVVSSHMNGDVRFWDEKSGTPQDVLQHDHMVGCFSFSSCGQWTATGCSSSVWLWKLVSDDARQEWRNVSVIRDFLGNVRSVAWSPRSLDFVTGCWDGSIRLWKLVDGSSGLSVQLVWSSGYTALVASDTTIADAVGLSAFNRKLLKQRVSTDELLMSE